MNYDLATNFDDDLIRRVADFGTVKSLYGKLAKDIIGGGRPSLVLPDISRKQLRNHISVAHNKGIKFNYLLNASCLDNKEFTTSFYKEFIALARQIKEDGADGVTVGSPSILSMVKDKFPDLKISTSIYMGVDSLDKIKHFEKMGASQITLSHNFTRDFPLLEKALKITDEKTELRLISNNVCLHNCPYMVPSHANLMAHSSQEKHESNGFMIDLYTLLCGLQKIKNPAEFLMSEWIRPEDVHYYEDIPNKNNLVLKLTDRARTTDWLVRSVQAYSQKSYSGNLFDILNYIQCDGYNKIRKGSMIKGVLAGKANWKEMMKVEKATFLPEVYIENQSLDGFLEHFIKSPCSNKTCYTSDKEYGECRFCYDLAQKVVSIREPERTESIGHIEELVGVINSGGMFK
jgi:collagenase-like PrtC family protease